MELVRVIIYPKDVALITGKSERQARNLLNKVRRQLGKGVEQFVTVDEFCRYVGLGREEVVRFLL